MKYFKILLIPFITFIFMVPTKALDEVPEWAYTDNYYVVSEYLPTGQLTVHILTSKNNYVIHNMFGNNLLMAPKSNFINSLRLNPGSNTWVSTTSGSEDTVNGVLHKSITYYNHSDYSIRFSNFDINIGGELVFPKTPVTNLAMVTQKAVENLEMEVQGTSGTISLVGGAILGLVLVPVLVSRLRHWVRV